MTTKTKKMISMLMMSTTLDFPLILILKLSSLEEMWLPKTTFNKNSKQKFAEIGK